MATMESSRKASYIGVWREDTFSDDVLKNIAAHAKAEKGKKVKLTMNKDGLRITRNRILKEDSMEFYPLRNLKTVAKNARSDGCVMFILVDVLKKYKIVVVRCESEADAIYVTNFFSQFKANNVSRGVELQKRGDTGNWTLRERSAHNASLHLREVFKEQLEHQPNGDINGNEVISDQLDAPNKSPNGILKPSSSPIETSFPYTDLNTGTSTTGWRNQEIKTTSSGGNNDEKYKALLQHASIAKKVEGPEGRYMSINRKNVLMPDKPRITDGRIYATRRMSGDLALFKQYQTARAVPARSSMVLKLDPGLTGTLTKQRASSMRVGNPQKLTTSSTVQRSIENTYAKPVIMQPRSRRASGGSIIVDGNQNQRYATVHVMGENRLQVHQDFDGMKL